MEYTNTRNEHVNVIAGDNKNRLWGENIMKISFIGFRLGLSLTPCVKSKIEIECVHYQLVMYSELRLRVEVNAFTWQVVWGAIAN